MKNDVYEKFAESLMIERKKRNMTRAELAAIVGVHPSQIVGYEHKKHMPSISVAVKLSEVFGMTVNRMCGDING